MIVHPIRTHIVTAGENIYTLLDKYLSNLQERDVIAIASKITGICEGRIIHIDKKTSKKDLIIKEAEYYIDDPHMRKFDILLTVKNRSLVASSGIDESNGNGSYILWPKDPDKTARDIWKYLRKTRRVKHVGVVITDSKTTPLRWGVTGFGVSWCGFKPLKNYTNTPDIFGRAFVFEQTSILDSLAAVGVFAMGEGREQTPLAIIRDAPHVEFTDHPPTQKDRDELNISFKDDIYSPLTDSKLWKKGGKS